jgi:hypothetical protein
MASLTGCPPAAPFQDEELGQSGVFEQGNGWPGGPKDRVAGDDGGGRLLEPGLRPWLEEATGLRPSYAG